MDVKFFVSNSSRNKDNKSIKRDKFFVYKNNNNISNNSLKNSNKNDNKKIKFQVFSSSGPKKNKILKNTKLIIDNVIYLNKKLKHNIPKISIRVFKRFIRSSIYRGVSKNGNKWQVLLMNEKIKYYLGNYKSEEVAAKIYDLFAIKIRGNKAKTNFFYTDEQFKNYMKLNIIFFQ